MEDKSSRSTHDEDERQNPEKTEAYEADKLSRRNALKRIGVAFSIVTGLGIVPANATQRRYHNLNAMDDPLAKSENQSSSSSSSSSSYCSECAKNAAAYGYFATYGHYPYS